jgi:hypothetical protein
LYRGAQAENCAKAGNGDGAIVVLFEGLSGKGSGVVDEVGAPGQGFEQID